MVELIKNIARKNNSIQVIQIMQTLHATQLSGKDRIELQQALQENYTLANIEFAHENLDPTIPLLDQAGRRYLKEDAASKLKCIAVLAKVKHHLNCLFFHLRENPILCTGADDVSNSQASKKRKAGDSMVGCDGAKKHSMSDA